MLKELLEKQRHYTDHFFNALDLTAVEQLLQRLLECKGILFFSGVGKSGLVAKKIAFTMVSTGTRAFYLSPTDALHGDLGMVASNDVFILFSKSGESDELMQLVPAIKNKGATLIGIVCNSQSRLGTACDMIFHLPFLSELCPFDMAPTMSTTAQQLLGDLLTIALMRSKNFSIDQYALNHPSGRIGKRMILKVQDLMLTGSHIPICHPEDRLGDILVELSTKRCGCILIADEESNLKGIFTDGDLRRSLQKVGSEILQTPIEKIMNPSPRSIGPEVLAWEAMKLMEADPQKRIFVLPVTDAKSKIIGIIHLHDIIQTGL